MKLRAYQEKAVNDVRSAYESGKKRIILQMPTGSGKTIVASDIIRRCVERGRRVIFLVNRRELAFQASDKLSQYGVEYQTQHAIIMANTEYFPAAPVQVCSIQTLYSRRRQLATLEPHMIIYDECHESVAPSRRKVLDHFRSAYWLGLSATPTRAPSRGSLALLWEEIISGPSYAELIAGGHLVPTRLFVPSVPDLTGAKTGRDGDFLQNADLRKRMETTAIYGNVFKEFDEHVKDRSCFVFAVDRAHSRGIADSFREHGIKAAHLDGATDKTVRDDTVAAFAKGEIQVIVNCNLFAEGTDIPRASCVINMRPSKSLIWWRQAMNRVQRPMEGKKDAIVMDHTGTCLRFGFPDSDGIEWDLGSEKDSFLSLVGKTEKKQSICRECGAYLEGSLSKCPECGHEFKRVKKLPPRFKGTLQELSRKRAEKESVQLNHQQEWMKCLAVAAYRHTDVNGAAGHFFAVTGMMPAMAGVTPIPERSQWKILVRSLYPGFVNRGKKRAK